MSYSAASLGDLVVRLNCCQGRSRSWHEVFTTPINWIVARHRRLSDGTQEATKTQHKRLYLQPTCHLSGKMISTTTGCCRRVLIEKFQNFSEPGDVLCSKDWLIPELSPVLLLQIHNVWSLGCVLWLCVLRVTGGRRCRKDKPTHCPKYEVNLVGAPSRFVLLVKNREAISQWAP